MSEVTRVDAGLRDHDLELVTALDNEPSPPGAEAAQSRPAAEDRAIRLDRDFDPRSCAHRSAADRAGQQWFAAGAHDKTGRCAWRPARATRVGERFASG